MRSDRWTTRRGARSLAGRGHNTQSRLRSEHTSEEGKRAKGTQTHRRWSRASLTGHGSSSERRHSRPLLVDLTIAHTCTTVHHSALRSAHDTQMSTRYSSLPRTVFRKRELRNSSFARQKAFSAPPSSTRCVHAFWTAPSLCTVLAGACLSLGCSPHACRTSGRPLFLPSARFLVSAR